MVNKTTMNVVDWSELQPELLELVTRKLTSYVDYVRFRAVCVNWRSAVPPNPHHLHSQLPWLMLPTHTQDENLCDFYDLLENKHYYLNISNSGSPRRHYCGSSQGWLFLLEDRSPSLLLFNPLTRIEIHLPPLTAFPDILDFNIDNVDNEYLFKDSKRGVQHKVRMDTMRYIFMNKFVLSSNLTSLNEDFVVVENIGIFHKLAFCKKGADKWTMIEDTKDVYGDVIYFKGLFYAVNNKNSVTVCDVSGLSPMVTIIEPPPIVSHGSPIVSRHMTIDYTMPYLVHSNGELLLVNRFFDSAADDHDLVVFHTVGFEVFKLDSSRPEWLEVSNIGDRILFLGTNSPLCLLATNFSGLKGNCIYFTGKYERYVTLRIIHDSGVFNLGSNSFKALPYSTGCEPSISSPSVWVTPYPY